MLAEATAPTVTEFANRFLADATPGMQLATDGPAGPALSSHCVLATNNVDSWTRVTAVQAAASGE
ncbi:hypothetical protein ACWEKM_09830 [Streptomyces sp. NPDC004752]